MKESELQKQIKDYLNNHPKVAWCMVTTTGMVKAKGSTIIVGFPGLADIIGQMTDGRLLAIEVKLPDKKPSEVQVMFLQLVAGNGGLSGWVDNIKDVDCILNRARAQPLKPGVI